MTCSPTAALPLKASVSTSSSPAPKKRPVWLASANHGRYGVDEYPGLATVVLDHPTLKPSSPCPSCAEANQPGRLYADTPGRILRLVGNPLVTGTRYQVVRLRCGLCGERYSEVPPGIAKLPKYSASVVSTLAISHYYLGLPFKRIELLQANQGVPLSDATQYDKMAAFEKQLLPLHRCLERLSANTTLISYDDTPFRVLKGAGVSGAQTTCWATAMVSECGPYTVYLFNTGRLAAGGKVTRLMSQRTSRMPLITMRDASPQNHLSAMDETLCARLILAFCLVHGRRNFYELLDSFPVECGYVVECIAAVYRHEAHCKQQKLSARERLAYHQRHSQPVMDTLWQWLTNQWQYGGIERNGALGKAIRYLLKHWVALTEFLRTEGCPLDNSHCERAIKLIIRYRKASLFYRTLRGAQVGDVLMSVIHTAVRNGVNAWDYLNALQAHPEAVAEAPECWLPWHYAETLRTHRAQVA